MTDWGRSDIVVVNADDFGISSQTSRDIAACFEAGRISSTTIMANMPGFDEACALARERGFADRVGVHLNLNHGPPLSDAIKPFCDEGGMLALPERRVTAPAEVAHAVYTELRAQLQRVIAVGIRPTHIDSHNHIINGLPYARMALRAAKELGIRRVRLTRNAFYRRTLSQTVFKMAYNVFLRGSGMRTVRRFTDVKPYVVHLRAGGAPIRGPLELMCHPGAPLDSPLFGARDETALLLGDDVGAAFKAMRLVGYGDI